MTVVLLGSKEKYKEKRGKIKDMLFPARMKKRKGEGGKGSGSIGGMVVVAIAMLLLSVQFCSGSQAPIRLGTTVSLQGPCAPLSLMMQKGYELWAAEVNKRGGMLGRGVELVFHDDGGDPALVGHLYRKLIEVDKVDLILTPCSSSLTLPAAEIAERYGYVLLAARASATALWERNFRYVFGISSTADRTFIGFLDQVARNHRKTVGVIYRNTLSHQSAAEGVKRWSTAFDLEVVLFEHFDSDEKELPAIVERVQESNVANLIFIGSPAESYFFIDLLQKNHYRPLALAFSGVAAQSDFFATVGPFAEGIFGASPWEAEERLPFPGVSTFIKMFREAYGIEPPSAACAAYVSAKIMERALLHVGAINQERIRDHIADLDIMTVMGRFRVDERGRQRGHDIILVQWQHGVREIVYPVRVRTARSRFVVAD